MSDVLITTETEYLEESTPLLETLEIGSAETMEIGQDVTEVLEVVTAASQEMLSEVATELLTEQVELIELLELTPAEQEIIEVAEQGPPGPPAEALPTSPSFTWLGGVLTDISYPDGSSKSLTWATDRLEQIDFLRPSLAGVRKNLSYNPDGTLAAIAQSVI